MGRLAEYVKKEAAHLKGEIEKRRTSLQEWRESLSRLYATLTGWIEEADGGMGLLQVEQGTRGDVREPALGIYDIPVLHIWIGPPGGSRRADVVPLARFVMSQVKRNGALRRADGMVEIREHGTPWYYLFRIETDGGDEWFIRSVGEWNADEDYGNAFPLDRDRFEAAALSILK